MNIFKNFTLKWWQAGLFKWGVFLLGIAVGACWPGIFRAYIAALFVIAAALLSYITYIWLRQVTTSN